MNVVTVLELNRDGTFVERAGKLRDGRVTAKIGRQPLEYVVERQDVFLSAGNFAWVLPQKYGSIAELEKAEPPPIALEDEWIDFIWPKKRYVAVQEFNIHPLRRNGDMERLYDQIETHTITSLDKVIYGAPRRGNREKAYTMVAFAGAIGLAFMSGVAGVIVLLTKLGGT